MSGCVFNLLSLTLCMSTLSCAGGAPPPPPPPPPAPRGGDGARACAPPARPRKNHTQPFTSLHDAPLWAVDFFDNLRLRPGRRRPTAGGGGVWVPLAGCRHSALGRQCTDLVLLPRLVSRCALLVVLVYLPACMSVGRRIPLAFPPAQWLGARADAVRLLGVLLHCLLRFPRKDGPDSRSTGMQGNDVGMRGGRHPCTCIAACSLALHCAP